MKPLIFLPSLRDVKWASFWIAEGYDIRWSHLRGRWTFQLCGGPAT